MRKLVALLALLMLPLAASAEIFKCKDAGGNVIYSVGVPQGCVAQAGRPQASRAGNKTPSPADFPRVSPEVQQARDMTRRGILEKELQAERMLLASASPDKSYLHERNIQAINRELSYMRYQ